MNTAPPESSDDVRQVDVVTMAEPIVAFTEGVVQSAAQVDHGSFGVGLKVSLRFTPKVVLALCYLQRSEQAEDGFHLFAFLREVIIQGIADAFCLRIGKQLRKTLGADQPSKEGDHQGLLYGIFLNMVFHRSYLRINAARLFALPITIRFFVRMRFLSA